MSALCLLLDLHFDRTIYKPESCEVRKKWIEKLFEVKFNQYQTADKFENQSE